MGDKMNKNRKLMHDLNGVADKFVTEAAPKKKALNISRMPWVYVGGAACAAAVLIMVGMNLPERSDSEIFAPAATDITSTAVTESITDFTVTEKPVTAQKIVVTVPSTEITGSVSEALQSAVTEASTTAAETAKQTEKKQESNNKPAETEKKPEVTEKAETTVSTEYEHMEDINDAAVTSVTKNPDGSIRIVIRDGQFAVTLPASWNGHFVLNGHNCNNYTEFPDELALVEINSKLAYQTEDYYDSSVLGLTVASEVDFDYPIHYDTVGYSRGEYMRQFSSIPVDRCSCTEEAYQEKLALLDTRDQIIYESYSEKTGKLERTFTVPECPIEAVSGECGSTTKWEYDSKSKTLTILAKSDDETDWMLRTQGYSVARAPWKEMSWYKEIENVVVKDGVQHIGIDAFTDCTSLKSITTPDDIVGVTYFTNCTSLTSITVPENTECIGNDVFSGCTNLKEVKIGSKLTEIMHGSFQGCTALETLDLPETVTKISDYAFKNCSPDLVLRCKEGSYVQQYAEAHGIKFEAVAE